jgi:hypothetical protein
MGQHYQQHHIRCTVANQQLASTVILIERPSIPEVNRQLAIGVLQVNRSRKTEPCGDAL